MKKKITKSVVIELEGREVELFNQIIQCAADEIHRLIKAERSNYLFALDELSDVQRLCEDLPA